MITRFVDAATGADSSPTIYPVWSGRHVRLRAIRPEDCRTLARFDRDTTTSGGYQHWSAHRRGGEDADLHLAIETLRAGLLVGSVSTTSIDAGRDEFSYGIGIGPWHWRCGYAADAITTLLALMFHQRGYHACQIGIYGNNWASRALHARLGFREQQRLSDSGPGPGKGTCHVQMSISATQFAAHHPNFALPWRDNRDRRGRHWRDPRGRHWRGPTQPALLAL